MFNSFLFLASSKSVVLSLTKTLFLDELFFLNSANSLASFSLLVTKNSAPANAESFMPNISTGMEGKASFTFFPS